jgi:hypothetical protein
MHRLDEVDQVDALELRRMVGQQLVKNRQVFIDLALQEWVDKADADQARWYGEDAEGDKERGQ